MARSFPLLSAALFAAAMVFLPSGARADDDAKIQAVTERLGRICKNKVAETYTDSVMADITVAMGATLRHSIDSGEITLADIKKTGLSFDWKVKRKGPDPHGYCNVEYDGSIDDFSVN